MSNNAQDELNRAKQQLYEARQAGKRLKRQKIILKAVGFVMRFLVNWVFWAMRPRTRVVFDDKLLEVALIYRWYDCWIGAYFDAGNNRLYVLPFFMVGLRITGKIKARKPNPKGVDFVSDLATGLMAGL